MDAKTIEWIIFGPLIFGLILISWWAMGESHKRLDDPNDDRTVYLNRLRQILKLAPYGVFRVTIYRQSGNIHAEHQVTGSKEDALNTAIATFRRAGIDAVHVGANNETQLRIGRLYHDHRGRKEGKKIGKAHIALEQRMEAPASTPIPVPDLIPATLMEASEPSISIQNIGITCDCGQRSELAFAAIRNERVCEGCGKDATLTPVQIAQLEVAAEDAQREAMARYHAGETDIFVERKSKLAGDEPTTLTDQNIKFEAAKEAVEHLGLIKSGAIATIVGMMHGLAEHPRAIATAYRKDGAQLSRDEKKAAHIRANAFMSRQAYEDLTDKGKANPLNGHELTLLRAGFTENRYRRIRLHDETPDNIKDYFVGFEYQTHSSDCPFCKRVDGTIVQNAEVAILPSPDCVCETANYFVSAKMDWLKNIA
ncbi:hypothetical protein [Sphingobium baderi]|uniref:hypothetical protein n=1 Tax=Sphingobium baderi TaxID=1332080 RepID=UPI002B41828B|nr:hypothetical protein [Sphingobium baderi]WRD77192.1 hypothetical protein QQ987_03370 [Sphingobium baderi]